MIMTVLAGNVDAAEPVRTMPDTMTMTQDARCRQVLVNCVVNGVPMRMMLDTGATNTVLHRESLKKLKNPHRLDTSNMQFRGNANERPDVYLLNLQFAGSAAVRNHPVMALSLEGARSMMDEQIDGIIGMDILGAMPFTFDVSNGRLHWGLPEEDLKLVPLHGRLDDGGRLILSVECDGKKHEILLDSGSTLTRLPAAAWPAGAAHEVDMNVSDVNAAASLKATVGAPGTVKFAPGVEVQGVTPVFCGDEEPTILGMDILSRVRLVHVPSSSHPSGYFFIAL